MIRSAGAEVTEATARAFHDDRLEIHRHRHRQIFLFTHFSSYAEEQFRCRKEAANLCLSGCLSAAVGASPQQNCMLIHLAETTRLGDIPPVYYMDTDRQTCVGSGGYTQ